MLTDFLKSFLIASLATAALASSALAAEGTLNGDNSTYVDGTVEGVVSVNVSNIPSSGSVDTVLLIDTTNVEGLEDSMAYGGTVYASAADAAAADDAGAPYIVHIDETKIVESTTGSNTFVINANLTEGHRYELRLGGLDDSDNGVTLRQYWFKVGGDVQENPYYTDGSWKIGDANGTGDVTSADAAAILTEVVNKTETDMNKLQAMDVNDTGDITSADGAEVLTSIVSIGSNPDLGTIAEKDRFVEPKE